MDNLKPMKYFIDNIEINPKIIGPPAMNYGQLSRYHGKKQVDYACWMSKIEFLEKFETLFVDLKNEEILDNHLNEEGEFPILDKWKDIGYPDLANLMEDHIDLLKELIIFNDLEVLNELDVSELSKTTDGYYAINSLDWVKIESDISFGGVAFWVEK